MAFRPDTRLSYVRGIGGDADETRNDAWSPQGGSNMMRTRILTVAVLAAALSVSTALAQQQQPPGTQRVSGTIERVDGNTIYGKGSDGSAITLKLADNVAITAVM